MCVWVEDADKLELNSKELNIVYKTEQIDRYLGSLTCLGLAGTKGQGKTFLIKVKRKLCEDKRGIICLPKGFLMDTIDSAINIDISLSKLLNSYENWVNIWKFSLASAIINNSMELLDDNSFYLKSKTKRLLSMRNDSHSPSVYFTYLLRSNISEVKEILNDTSTLLNLIRKVNTETHIYIDKIDQSFSPYLNCFSRKSIIPKNLKHPFYWEYAQLSLAEAAYDIYTNCNHHIKINYTIRQEALINITEINPDKARNIKAYRISLMYTKEDLKGMYSLYVKNESNKNLVDYSVKEDFPSQAFLGHESLDHGYISGASENMFDYIFRHTFKRPYDIMYICNKLSLMDSGMKKNFDKIRHTVNIASSELLKNYISELSEFLPRNAKENILKIMHLISCNVLTKDLMAQICLLFHYENPTKINHRCTHNCNNCQGLHVFSVMYNLGLLGKIRQHEADPYPKIRFENVASRLSVLKNSVIPVAKYYVLHPSVSYHISSEREASGQRFIHTKSFIIGDEYYCKNTNFEETLSENLNSMKELIKKEKVFISSTIKDLKNERRAARSILKEKHLHPIMSEYADFCINDAPQIHSHDLCIEELLKCKNCIFIIGEEYGGIYNGNLYKNIVNDIIKESANKISKVSISLMEFYMARKNNINTYIFIEQQKLDNKESLQDELKHEVDFITHFTKGNWIIGYKDIKDLKIRLSACKF